MSLVAFQLCRGQLFYFFALSEVQVRHNFEELVSFLFCQIWDLDSQYHSHQAFGWRL